MTETSMNRNSTSFPLQLFEYFRQATFDDEYAFLKYYQNITRLYAARVRVGSRGLLVNHTMGMGKSILGIAMAIDTVDSRPVILLLTKSLQDNMRQAIKKYVRLRTGVDPTYRLGAMTADELDAWIAAHFSFVSLNAGNMLKQMGKAAEGNSARELDALLEKKFGDVLKMPSLNGKRLIIDEAHNFFRAITNGSKNAIGLYDMIMKSTNLELVFLTGTPVSNDVFELVPCFNMLAGQRPIFPESYHDFRRLFIDPKTGAIRNREYFQNRIFGLVSYVTHHSSPGKAIGNTSDDAKPEFPEEYPAIIERVHMATEQFVIYQLARDKEAEEGKGRGARSDYTPAMTKPKGNAASTYRVRSRQLGNYCPPIAQLTEKDPAQLTSVDSPKFTALDINIAKHPNQIGIVYSQFKGVGGLGSYARHLESRGWQRYMLPPADKRTTVTQQPPGEEGELDEYDDTALNVFPPDAASAIATVDTVIGGSACTMDIADTHLAHINEQTNDTAGWWGAGDTEMSFKYAATDDADAIRALHPEYKHDPLDIAYPKHILLIYEGDKLAGYVNIEYKIYTEDSAATVASKLCIGRITGEYLGNLSEQSSRAAIKKIIEDALNCRDHTAEFKRAIWGGMVDPSGATARATSQKAAGRPLYYAMITGDVDITDRARLQDIFNDVRNKHGGIIDLLLISSTGAEGLDLHNVRHVNIMEPYWNIGRILQVIARGARNDSHIQLPPNERNVQPYIYLAIPPESERSADGTYVPTTDTEMYDEALRDHTSVESFMDAIHEVSIECMINDEPRCRRCNPTGVPLYTDDIERDVKSADPCQQIREESVVAAQITVAGEEFQYVADPTSIYDYRVYVFDPQVNAHRPLAESDPRYEAIIEAIIAANTAT